MNGITLNQQEARKGHVVYAGVHYRDLRSATVEEALYGIIGREVHQITDNLFVVGPKASARVLYKEMNGKAMPRR